MSRKRGTIHLPEDMQTSERLSTKKELAQRGSRPSCPAVPVKVRRNLLHYKNSSIRPKLVCFNNNVTLSPIYNPKIGIPYIDQVFAKYKFMGEGSFGKVYRVRSKEDRKVYAIKRLKSNVSYNDRYAEVQNNERVGSDPNCVQFYMAWEENCETFMLLEYCDLSLADYAKKNNDISEELLWNVLLDMCKALNFLHRKDLVHLDVKPGNIMMKNGIYKLGDFGLLVDLKTERHGGKSTLSDGDSRYLALEILEGIYTPFCDIFGLGISLLELAADLALPDHGPLWQQLRHNILPQHFYDKVTLGFKVIVEKMLIPEYHHRPSAEKILRFNRLKLLAKRDTKQPRTNFAADIVSNDEYDTLPLSPIPLNRNIITTPTHRSSRDIENSANSGSPSFTSRRPLFHFLTPDSPYSSCRSSLSPFSDSLSNDSSILAEDLHDSSLEVKEPQSMEGVMITSTPILKVRNNRRILRSKLTFD